MILNYNFVAVLTIEPLLNIHFMKYSFRMSKKCQFRKVTGSLD